MNTNGPPIKLKEERYHEHYAKNRLWVRLMSGERASVWDCRASRRREPRIQTSQPRCRVRRLMTRRHNTRLRYSSSCERISSCRGSPVAVHLFDTTVLSIKFHISSLNTAATMPFIAEMSAANRDMGRAVFNSAERRKLAGRNGLAIWRRVQRWRSWGRFLSLCLPQSEALASSGLKKRCSRGSQ